MNDTNTLPTETSRKHQQIVDAAFKLFKENGFYATGVDLIMRQANVSKRTLYVYFPTKNDLIVAVLKHYLRDYRRNVNELFNREELTGREKILAIFDGTKAWFEDTHFHGCLAVNAMGEFAGKDPAIESACREFKEWELGLFRDLADATGAVQPEDLAYKLFILMEGIGAIARVTKRPCPIDIGNMVEELLNALLSA